MKDLSTELNCYILNVQIKNSYDKIAWFTNHLSRCKKDFDKAKLSSIIMAETTYFMLLVNEAKKEIEILKNELLER